jgi:CBS domain-containing protein
LGRENICVYLGGKEDWLAFDLPIDGELAHQDTAGRIAQRDVVLCAPEEKLAEVRVRVERVAQQSCVVVNKAGAVEGLLAEQLWQGDGALTVEQVMDPAPLTVRPHTLAKAAAERMRKQQRDAALVTTPDGKLVGIFRQK